MHQLRVEGAPERSLCMTEPTLVPLAPEDLAALEQMRRDLTRWGVAMRVTAAERRGQTVDPDDSFDVSAFDQGFVMRAWKSESGRVTWKLEVLSIEGAGGSPTPP